MVLVKNQIQEVLEKYNIGKYKSHKHLKDVFENDVYILRTGRGKYILKVLRKVSLKHMREQLEVIDFLYSNNIPVVKNIRDKQGKEIVTYNKKKIIIQSFVEGVHVQDFDKFLVKDIAKNIGKMHSVLLESKFRTKKRNERVYTRRNKGFIKEHGLKRLQDELFKNLNNMDKVKLKKARVHSDITEQNILVNKNKLKAFIDWDDSADDYLVYDIAIFLAHITAAKKHVNKEKIEIDKEKIRVFLKEYQKYIKLNNEEKKAIYYLMNYRLFGILNWYIQYSKSRPDRSKIMNKGIKRNVWVIKSFKEFGLEDFLKLF